MRDRRDRRDRRGRVGGRLGAVYGTGVGVRPAPDSVWLHFNHLESFAELYVSDARCSAFGLADVPGLGIADPTMCVEGDK